MGSKRLRVLQIGMTSNIGGMETYLIEQYRHLDKDKLTYDFMNITNEYPMVYRDEILANGDHIYGVPSRHIHPVEHWWHWYIFLKKNHDRFNAIVLNTCDQSVSWPILLGKLFGIKRRVVHSHNAGNEVKSSLFRRVLYGLNRMIWNVAATDYFACSDDAGRWMFPGEKYTLIKNAIDVKRFRFNSNIRENIRDKLGVQNDFVIGHIGRFTYQKNHIFMLEMLKELIKIRPEIRLLLVGNYECNRGISEAFFRKLREYNLEKYVILTGPQINVKDYYSAMDCFILPSLFEGLPIVGIEAQANGVPCIFSDTITKELSIGANVRFLPLNDAKLWAEELNHITERGRMDNTDAIANAGYSIVDEVKKVEMMFCKG